MNAHPAMLAWPTVADDELGLALWTARDIARATGGQASGEFAVSGVEIDSRDAGVVPLVHSVLQIPSPPTDPSVPSGTMVWVPLLLIIPILRLVNLYPSALVTRASNVLV